MSRLPAVLATALLMSLLGAREERPAPLTLRVLTYNIHHGEGRDGQLDLQRIAGVMESVQPDVIALQEVDQRTQRSGGVDQVAELARLMHMHAAFGRALDYRGGGYGVAVLSRWPLVDPSNHPLPTSLDREPRTALTVRIRVGGEGPWLSFTSTHLDSGRSGSTDRLAQAIYLNEVLADGGEQPSILAGDMNAREGTDVMRALDMQWANAVALAGTEPIQGRRRGLRGDYVLFRPVGSWRVVETTILDERVASDHRPVLSVLEWRGKG